MAIKLTEQQLRTALAALRAVPKDQIHRIDKLRFYPDGRVGVLAKPQRDQEIIDEIRHLAETQDQMETASAPAQGDGGSGVMGVSGQQTADPPDGYRKLTGADGRLLYLPKGALVQFYDKSGKVELVDHPDRKVLVRKGEVRAFVWMGKRYVATYDSGSGTFKGYKNFESGTYYVNPLTPLVADMGAASTSAAVDKNPSASAAYHNSLSKPLQESSDPKIADLLKHVSDISWGESESLFPIMDPNLRYSPEKWPIDKTKELLMARTLMDFIGTHRNSHVKRSTVRLLTSRELWPYHSFKNFPKLLDSRIEKDPTVKFYYMHHEPFAPHGGVEGKGMALTTEPVASYGPFYNTYGSKQLRKGLVYIIFYRDLT